MTDKTDAVHINEKVRVDIIKLEKQLERLKSKELADLESILRGLTNNLVIALRLTCSTDEDCPSNCRCVDSRCKRDS